MKKDVLNDIDKIKEGRKIPKDVEKKIFIRTITNFGIGISIILLVMIFYIIAKYLSKNIAVFTYNSFAFVMLIATLVMIEIAYKKDSGKCATTAIEMLVVSIYSLFAPHIFVRISYKYIYGFIALTTIYYTFKIVKIYFSETQKYLTKISDIAKIIQKESKDELAEEEKKKQKERIKKMQEKEAKTTRKSTAKRNTAKKSTTAKKTTTTKTTKPSTKKTGTTKKATTKKSTTKSAKTPVKSTTTTKKTTSTTKKKATKKSNN